MRTFCSRLSIFVLGILGTACFPYGLNGQQPADVLKQEVNNLVLQLQDESDPEICFDLLSALKLHGKGGVDALPILCTILRDPRHSAKRWFFPTWSVHDNALEVFEAIGPESMEAITSLLAESSLTDNLTGYLLATGSRIAEKSDRRFSGAAREIERLVNELGQGDNIEDKEHLLGMAAFAFGAIAEPNDDSLEFLISLLPEGQTRLKERIIASIGDLGYSSPKALAVLRGEFLKTQVGGGEGGDYSLETIVISYGQLGLRDPDIEAYLLKTVKDDSSAIWRVWCANSLLGISATEQIGLEALWSELHRVLRSTPVHPADIQVVSLLLKHLKEARIQLLRQGEALLIEAVFKEELDSQRIIAFELLDTTDSPLLNDIALRLMQSSHLPIRIQAMAYLSEKYRIKIDNIESVYEGVVSEWDTQVDAVRILGRLKSRSSIYLEGLERIWLDRSRPVELRLEAYNAIQLIRQSIADATFKKDP